MLIKCNHPRAIVCGGRTFKDRDFLFEELDRIKPSIIIHGAAPGADTLSEDWALSRNIPYLPFFADWKNQEGRKPPFAFMKKGRYGYYDVLAGFTRNQKMIDIGKPDIAIAFTGGKGTADMIEKAMCLGLEVIRVKKA